MSISKISRIVALPLGIAALAASLVACSSTPAEPTVTVNENTIVLDVRTPEEYAGGHLEGAQLLDFNSGELQAAIPTMDPSAEYLIYCRSGNRAGQAMTLMQQAGIDNVVNLGSVEDAAAATGITVVK